MRVLQKWKHLQLARNLKNLKLDFRIQLDTDIRLDLDQRDLDLDMKILITFHQRDYWLECEDSDIRTWIRIKETCIGFLQCRVFVPKGRYLEFGWTMYILVYVFFFYVVCCLIILPYDLGMFMDCYSHLIEYQFGSTAKVKTSPIGTKS